MRRVKLSVPLEVCKSRALLFLSNQRIMDLFPASWVANAIWPGTTFKAQGAGAAASWILQKMILDETVIWDSTSNGLSKSWGYRLTSKGRGEAERLAREGR